jgi:hypothetical protein
MTCGRARRLLWPDSGPREATEEIIAAREHASGCDACQIFLDDMRRLSMQISRGAARAVAPPEMRDRLFRTIAVARTSAAPARAARLRSMAFAVIAALLVFGLSWMGYLAVHDGSSGNDMVGSIVEDRLRSQKSAGLASSDSLQVAQWLSERLPFAVQVPIFPDARLVGARLLVDDQLSGAVVEYAVQGLVLTYYVLPGAAAGLARHVQTSSRNGYRVASWHDAGLTHALVATLPGSKLIEYARYCMHQMMA